MVTKARKADLRCTSRDRRNTPHQNDAARKLMKDIAPKYKGRAGGYIRILKLPPRKSDASPMAIIEFV